MAPTKQARSRKPTCGKAPPKLATKAPRKNTPATGRVAGNSTRETVSLREKSTVHVRVVEVASERTVQQHIKKNTVQQQAKKKTKPYQRKNPSVIVAMYKA